MSAVINSKRQTKERFSLTPTPLSDETSLYFIIFDKNLWKLSLIIYLGEGGLDRLWVCSLGQQELSVVLTEHRPKIKNTNVKS
jgi:hypothetical protein